MSEIMTKRIDELPESKFKRMKAKEIEQIMRNLAGQEYVLYQSGNKSHQYLFENKNNKYITRTTDNTGNHISPMLEERAKREEEEEGLVLLYFKYAVYNEKENIFMVLDELDSTFEELTIEQIIESM